MDLMDLTDLDPMDTARRVSIARTRSRISLNTTDMAITLTAPALRLPHTIEGLTSTTRLHSASVRRHRPPAITTALHLPKEMLLLHLRALVFRLTMASTRLLPRLTTVNTHLHLHSITANTRRLPHTCLAPWELCSASSTHLLPPGLGATVAGSTWTAMTTCVKDTDTDMRRGQCTMKALETLKVTARVATRIITNTPVSGSTRWNTRTSLTVKDTSNLVDPSALTTTRATIPPRTWRAQMLRLSRTMRLHLRLSQRSLRMPQLARKPPILRSPSSDVTMNTVHHMMFLLPMTDRPSMTISRLPHPTMVPTTDLTMVPTTDLMMVPTTDLTMVPMVALTMVLMVVLMMVLTTAPLTVHSTVLMVLPVLPVLHMALRHTAHSSFTLLLH